MLGKETTATANRIEPMEVAALGGLPDDGKGSTLGWARAVTALCFGPGSYAKIDLRNHLVAVITNFGYSKLILIIALYDASKFS